MNIDDRFAASDLEKHLKDDQPIDCQTCGAMVKDPNLHHDWHLDKGE